MAYTDYEKSLVMNGVLKRYELQILDSSNTEIDLIGANRMDYESANLLKNLSSSDQKLEFGLALSSHFKCTFHNLASGLTENDYTNKKIIITQKFEYINDSDIEVTASELVATMFVYYVKSINKKSSQYELLAYDAIQFEQWEDINLGSFMNLPSARRTDSNLFAFAMREKMGGLKNSGMTFSEYEVTGVVTGYNVKAIRGEITCNSAEAYSHAMIILNLINQSALNTYVPAGFKTASPDFFKVRVQNFSDDNYTTLVDEYYMDTKQGIGQLPIGGSIKFTFRTYLYYIYPTGGTPTSFNKDLIDDYDTYLTNRNLYFDRIDLNISTAIQINIPSGLIKNQFDIINDIGRACFLNYYVDKNGNYTIANILKYKDVIDNAGFDADFWYKITNQTDPEVDWIREFELYTIKRNFPNTGLYPNAGLYPNFQKSLIRVNDLLNCDILETILETSDIYYNTNSDLFFETINSDLLVLEDNSKRFQKNPMIKAYTNPYVAKGLRVVEPIELFDDCYKNLTGGSLALLSSLAIPLYYFLQFLTYTAGTFESRPMPWLEMGESVIVDTPDKTYEILNIKQEIKGISIAQTQTITSM